MRKVSARIRRHLCLLLGGALLCLMLAPAVAALNPQPLPPVKQAIQVNINGSPLQMGVSPMIVGGHTLVPLRAIFEALGATMQWNPADQSIIATKGNLTIKLQIGSTSALNNGTPVTLDAAPMIVNGSTLVPARFVSEALGAQVVWDAANQQVNIITASSQANPPVGVSGSGSGVTTPAANLPNIFGSLVNVPSWIVSGLEQPSTSKEFDSAFIGRDLLIAKPVDPGLLKQIMANYVPPTEDFSQYLTLTENQDGWGGCIGRSMTHVMDIQNQMECPYTPDQSDWYVHIRQEEIANGGPVNTGYLLENYGDCPEAYLPTDYDKATDNGGVIDLSTMPQPTATNDQEAAFYKIAFLSDPITPDKDVMKQLMLKYGPILLEGNIPHVADNHCMTVIGWDDNYNGVGAFKLLNSWGDHWGPDGDGTYWLTYSDLAAGAQNLDNRYIQHGTVDRTGTKYAYSARINLQGGASALRNGLTVSIAAAGQEPWVFWDQPNHLKDPYCYDNSQNLCIDIPLPDYAAANWLPSANAQWSIQVTNHNSGAVTLQEFTVARQYKDAKGNLAVETFSSGQKGASIQGDSTASFTISANWVTGVTISPSILNLTVGATSTPAATVAPSNAYNKAVTWSSDNAGVATVDQSSGLVTAVAAGYAHITATTVGTWSSGYPSADSVTVDVTQPFVIPKTVPGLNQGILNTLNAVHFVVSAPASAVAGTPFNFTVTAQTLLNSTASGYSGTVSFTSDDQAASLPPFKTLTNGAGTFNAIMKTAGNQTITATDASNPAITGSATIAVIPAISIPHRTISITPPVNVIQ